MDEFVREQWAGRLIRGWTDGWLDWPLRLGDRLGAVALGAAAGQVVVADSTTVLLYKLARAAVDARPGRRKVVLDTDNFPTDRYVLEGIAAERGLTCAGSRPTRRTGITPEQVAEVGRRRHRAGAVQPRRVPVGLARRRRGDHPDRARRRRAGAVGPEPLGRLGAGGAGRLGRGPRGRAARTSTSTAARARRRSPTCARGLQDELRQPIQRLDGAPGGVRDGPGLRARARHPRPAQRHPADPRHGAAARQPGHAGRGRHRRGPGQVRPLLTATSLDLADAWLVAAGRRGGQPARPGAPRRARHAAPARLREAARAARGRRA